MRTISVFSIMFCLFVLWSCMDNNSNHPRAKHVILIGLDGMGARGLQRAHTPNFNSMIENGAVSINARCLRPTISSQNWMSMLSGANIEMHGVTGNDWTIDLKVIEPAVKNRIGIFPTIFDHIKTQRPDAKVYLYYEWKDQERMYDIGIVDKAVTDKTGSQLLDEAIDAFFEDKPEFLFISIDETDHIGHVNGHETKQFMDMITHYDAMIGRLIDRLRAENLLDETVVIVTADHGGIKDSHGGDSAAELEIPIILYGGNVTKGKVLERTNFICDIAATVGGLLGVELPQECVGKFICEAFEPVTGKEYVPMPFIFPVDGMFKDYADVTITGDVDGGEIYYTLDGSVPTTNSIKYEGAFEVDKSVQIQAVVYKNGQSGELAEAMLRIVPKDEIPKVAYKYYPNMMKKNLPDFKGLGKPSREGYVHEFSLDELNVEEEDHFAVLFTAKLKIDEDGEYTFGISSDDGAKLYVNGKEVIDNDGSHSTNMKYGKIMLTQGIQEIKVEYFDDYMGQDLMLCYKTKDKPLQVLPFAQLVK